MFRIQATKPESTFSRRRRQGLFFLCVFYITSPLCGQQNIVTIVSEQNPSLRGAVGTFTEEGIVYGSLRDIATDLSIALYQSDNKEGRNYAQAATDQSHSR
jgi:hypothetical protein